MWLSMPNKHYIMSWVVFVFFIIETVTICQRFFTTNSIRRMCLLLYNIRTARKVPLLKPQQLFCSGMKNLASFTTGRAAFRSVTCTPDIDRLLSRGRDGFEFLPLPRNRAEHR